MINIPRSTVADMIYESAMYVMAQWEENIISHIEWLHEESEKWAKLNQKT